MRLLFIGTALLTLLTGCAPSMTSLIINGDCNGVKKAVEEGADKNQLDQYSFRTPLINSIIYNQKACAQYFVDIKADVNKGDFLGQTPLIHAINSRQDAFFEIVLSAKPNISQADNNGLSPLYYAAFTGNRAQFDTLIADGADINVKTKQGSSLMFAATDGGSIPMIQYLLDKGFSLNEKNSLGQTPMHLSVRKGSVESLKFALSKGGSFSHISAADPSPLHETGYAAYANVKYDAETVRLAIKEGLNPNHVSQNGDTPLHIIIPMLVLALDYKLYDHEKSLNRLVTVLIENGADLNARNKAGATPASLLAKYPAYVYQLSLIKPQSVKAAAIAPPPTDSVKQDVNAFVTKNDIEGLKKYLDKNPAAIAGIEKPEVRVMMYGPSSLRVDDLKKHLQAGMGQKLLITQITVAESGYKKFSMDEVVMLQKNGIPEDIISAMISRTAELEKAGKQATPVAPVQQQYQQQQVQQQVVPQQQGNTIQQEVTNQIINKGVNMLFDKFNPFK